MQYFHHLRFSKGTYLSAAIFASTVLATVQVMAQQTPLTQPAKPEVELLEELPDSATGTETTSSRDSENIDLGINLDKRQTLLSNPDRVGFGSSTTGGSNEITVGNIEEFIAAVSQPDNYIRLAPSLAGQTLYVSDTIYIDAENITIDGSDAPGAVFTPSSSFQSNQVMMYSRGPNIIINNITLKANYYPSLGSSNNVGGIRFNNSGIWVNKVTVSGLYDDAFDMVLNGTNATFSRIKLFNTDKGMNMFYPHDSNKSISIHSSDLSARQRNPWNQGASMVHIWNNYIHGAEWDGTIAGLNEVQRSLNKYTNRGPAYVISENNVYSNNASQSLRAYDEPAGVKGYIDSIGNILNGTRAIGNVDNPSNPTLFDIPYDYNLLPTDQVKEYVLAGAGAS